MKLSELKRNIRQMVQECIVEMRIRNIVSDILAEGKTLDFCPDCGQRLSLTNEPPYYGCDWKHCDNCGVYFAGTEEDGLEAIPDDEWWETDKENRQFEGMYESLNKRPMLYLTEKNAGGKRKQVMKMLGDEKFEHAYLAYKLWHPKDQSEKDTYRSLFSKKYTGKPDADGTVRHFTAKEINGLYNILTKNK